MKELSEKYKNFVKSQLEKGEKIKLKDVEKHFLTLGYSKEDIHESMIEFYKEEHSCDEGFIP